MIDNNLFEAHRWADYLGKFEYGDKAIFTVKDPHTVRVLRVAATRLNKMPGRTFRLSVTYNAEKGSGLIFTLPIF